MYLLLSLALVCTAAASSGYGIPANDDPSYSPPANDNPSYSAPANSDNRLYYDYSSRSSSSSSDSSEERECRKLREFDLPSELKSIGVKAKFSEMERRGKTYTTISCPSNTKTYAIIADKSGSNVSQGDITIQDAVLLATGVNIDVVGRCRGRRTTVVANNGDEVKIKTVVCVELSTSPDKY
ncbi:Uterine Lumin Expressed/locailized [Caenorhabditis elegans]|uniref:Uterine Lumin Expressed/locailized n=1 Tax=Caenorhabditis elegans TaxID=6239 RepID=Q9XWT3_CAEEL|nr:Uterine Lumin Expressed/locailized [Caenorhabditis elegans]CAA21562.1 Uterine Lumin Expressed/locailized [Caenorhabditis elegans]|eukprot:NP_509987.1 Uterine Lumin Expressed/locailized [Caenorhabditis elegans]